MIAAAPAVMAKFDPNWRTDADQRAMSKANQIESRRRHFAGNLMSRGIFTSPSRNDALLGVLMANKRGGAESLECVDFGGESDAANPSPAFPPQPITLEARKQYLDAVQRRDHRFDACIAQTAATPACQSQQRCWEADNLP